MGYVYTENKTITLVTETCFKCGVMFAMTDEYKSERLKYQDGFYCPNGHSQRYAGKSEAEKLREKLATEQQLTSNLRAARDAALDQARHSHIERRKLQTRMKNLKTRIGNGVCPCCNRQFVNLQEHMKCEHPAFKNEEPA